MRFLLTLFFVGYTLVSYSQMDIIKLQNPSFEDTPRKGGRSSASLVADSSIKNWYDCGAINFPRESAPDIHPGDTWSVDNEPYDGETYLGLVVRDNETWESVCQELATKDETMTPLLGGECYLLSMAVLQADKYMSGSRYNYEKNGDRAQTYNYATPVVIRIWGGNSYCNKRELLATSDLVDNSEWETIELDFTPAEDYGFITIEAFYKLPVVIPYNGHVLIDNLSDIIQVECKD